MLTFIIVLLILAALSQKIVQASILMIGFLGLLLWFFLHYPYVVASIPFLFIAYIFLRLAKKQIIG